MMRYALVVEEGKEVVLAQDHSILQGLELLLVVAYVLVKQSVHPFLEGLPDLRPGRPALAFIPCVYGIAQQFLHTASPLLLLVDVAEVLQVPQQVGKADLVAADLQREVGAVTVRIEYEPLQETSLLQLTSSFFTLASSSRNALIASNASVTVGTLSKLMPQRYYFVGIPANP